MAILVGIMMILDTEMDIAYIRILCHYDIYSLYVYEHAYVYVTVCVCMCVCI